MRPHSCVKPTWNSSLRSPMRLMVLSDVLFVSCVFYWCTSLSEILKSLILNPVQFWLSYTLRWACCACENGLLVTWQFRSAKYFCVQGRNVFGFRMRKKPTLRWRSKILMETKSWWRPKMEWSVKRVFFSVTTLQKISFLITIFVLFFSKYIYILTRCISWEEIRSFLPHCQIFFLVLEKKKRILLQCTWKTMLKLSCEIF